MANYYKEINKILEKIIHRVLVIDRKGLKLGLKGEDFALLDIYILKIIGKNSEMSIYSIVEETEIDRGIVTSIVNKMVNGGYLTKEKSMEDKRVYNVKLTEEGKTIYSDLLRDQSDLLDFILSDITLNEEKAILKFLSKVKQKIKKD